MAIQYVDTSFIWSKKNSSNKYDLSNYNILGACHQNLLNFNIAITYYEKALKSADINGEIIEKPIIYRNLGSNYCNIKNFKKALFYGLKGYQLADSLGLKNNMIFVAFSLYLTYNEIRDYQNALKYLQISDSIKSVVFDETYFSKTKEFEAKFENQKNQIQFEKLSKKEELQSAEVKKQRIIIYSLILVFIIILIFSLVIYRMFLQIKKTSAIISNKNKKLENAHSAINQQNEKIKSQNERLIEFNLELENKINARTIELQEKNKEIEAQNEEYKKINEELSTAKEKSEEKRPFKIYIPCQYESRNQNSYEWHSGLCQFAKKTDFNRRKTAGIYPYYRKKRNTYAQYYQRHHKYLKSGIRTNGSFYFGNECKRTNRIHLYLL